MKYCKHCGSRLFPIDEDFIAEHGKCSACVTWKCTRNHREDLRHGDYNERAGGSLHCIKCGAKIGAFRQ